MVSSFSLQYLLFTTLIGFLSTNQDFQVYFKPWSHEASYRASDSQRATTYSQRKSLAPGARGNPHLFPHPLKMSLTPLFRKETLALKIEFEAPVGESLACG